MIHATKALCFMVLDKMIFPVFAYVKHVSPGRGTVWPQCHNEMLLGDATYINIKAPSKPFGSRNEHFKRFNSKNLC